MAPTPALVDWGSTCGFVEVRSKTLLTWQFMFARMADGSLYFFEDESEKSALFVVFSLGGVCVFLFILDKFLSRAQRHFLQIVSHMLFLLQRN